MRKFEQEEGETPDSLKEKVDELFTDQLKNSVVCVTAKRMQKGRNDAAQGIVVVQFEVKQHKFECSRPEASSQALPLVWMMT